jgi:putative transposase
LCNFFGVSRQAYYKGTKEFEKASIQQDWLIERVQKIRRSHTKMGGKKLYHLLKPGASMGRDKFFDLLRERKLLVRRYRKYATTTESKHRFRIYRNILQDFTAKGPHQAWVCDITYVRTRTGFVYLFLITDAYSRKILGWDLNKSLALGGAITSLKMACQQCPNSKDLIHHSDRGFQYCSYAYVALLKTAGIQISMAEAGNCYENAMAERVNGILKGEYGLDETFADEQQARTLVKQAIKVYNEQRPHWSLGLKIPKEVHEPGIKTVVNSDNLF